MNPLHEARMHVRRELEAPPALRTFGSGWISGVLGLMLGMAAVAGVIMIWFPGVFTTARMSKAYATGWPRPALFGVIIGGFVFRCSAWCCETAEVLGMTGMAATLLALTMGGSSAAPLAADASPLYFGLDFFAAASAAHRAGIHPDSTFPRRPEQGVFRYEWREDFSITLSAA